MAPVYPTYQDILDDHDINECTLFNSEYVFGAWSVAIGLLMGTTTIGQTKTIANKEIDKQ